MLQLEAGMISIQVYINNVDDFSIQIKGTLTPTDYSIWQSEGGIIRRRQPGGKSWRLPININSVATDHGFRPLSVRLKHRPVLPAFFPPVSSFFQPHRGGLSLHLDFRGVFAEVVEHLIGDLQVPVFAGLPVIPSESAVQGTVLVRQVHFPVVFRIRCRIRHLSSGLLNLKRVKSSARQEGESIV